MNRKGLAPIIILLVIAGVLVVSGIWYYASHPSTTSLPINTIGPSPTPTTPSSTVNISNWKTYSNDQYGFQAQYPAALSVQLNQTDFVGKSIFGVEFWNDCGECIDASPFVAGIYVTTSTLEAEERGLREKIPSVQKQNVVINNQNIAVFTYTSGAYQEHMSRAVISHGNYLYVIAAETEPSLAKSLSEEQFNRFVSSLKFQ